MRAVERSLEEERIIVSCGVNDPANDNVMGLGEDDEVEILDCNILASSTTGHAPPSEGGK